MAHIIAIANHKGGCAKTTSTINIGAALAKGKHTTLLVDLDPQANLTASLGIEPEQQQHNIYTALTKGEKLQPVQVAPYLQLVPSTVELIGADSEMAGKLNKEHTLGWVLSKVHQQYEYILLDCPPSLGLLTLNALTAADYVYIPLQAHFLALQGLTYLQQAIELVQTQYNKRLQLGGVFITQYDQRKVLHRNVKEMAEQMLGAAVCKTAIRDNIALAEAPTAGQTIYQYAPKSNGAADYKALAREIHKRCQ